MTEVSCAYKPQPTQSVRTKYKARCGSAPYVASFQPSITESTTSIRNLFDIPEECESGEPEERKVLEAGDIVGVLAGTEDGLPSEDDFWLFRLSRDVFNLRPSPRSQLHGVYLEHIETDRRGNQCYAISNINRVLRYNNVLKDEEKAPYILVKEAYQLKLLDEVQVVEISPEVAHELTLLAHKVDEEEEDEEERLAEVQDNHGQECSGESVQVQPLPRFRSRNIRGRGGEEFTSYKTFAKVN